MVMIIFIIIIKSRWDLANMFYNLVSYWIGPSAMAGSCQDEAMRPPPPSHFLVILEIYLIYYFN
jgi:hypothetical protein